MSTRKCSVPPSRLPKAARKSSKNIPLHKKWTADTQYLEAAEGPQPRCHWWQQCQQMEPKIMVGPGLLFKTLYILSLLRPHLCCDSRLSLDPILPLSSPSTLHAPPPHPAPCSLKYSSYFLFSWKPIQEGCCTKAACQMTASKKILEALPVVLLSPMKLNYSFSWAGDANVIADFLNKQHHHYNNHQDFYSGYFYSKSRVFKVARAILIFSLRKFDLWGLVFNFIFKGYYEFQKRKGRPMTRLF